MDKREGARRFYRVTLLALFFAIASFVRPVHAKGRIIFHGEDMVQRTKVVLQLTEFKPGSYTVVGSLSLQEGRVTCPIKGTYYEGEDQGGVPNDRLRATAYHSGLGYELIIDGGPGMDNAGSRIMRITVKDPKSNIIYFVGPLEFEVVPEGETTKFEKPPPPDLRPKAGEVEDAAPTIEGKNPSPPETREEWDGRWKVKGKASSTIVGSAPTVREWEYEMRTVREGQKIRLIGDREFVFNLSASNPNVATFKEQRKETNPLGWSEVVDRRVVFLREGRLYMTVRQEITSHTSLPGLPATVGHATNDSIGIADRVK